ncbi:NADH:flavin oxidoreductase [Konateibacter massiliensis]|uniref:NADH:flavin oxidoreductase n=1 Tax=Konateibacter massiliensis TaxID=2002841 RepID=UPI000C1451BE|nr:NADH:flavin oxidoreductase [Konateibacter massiliensis]
MNLLTQPITIKNVEIKNRIVMPPMATSKSEGGQVTQELVDYYDEKSKGGYIGLIITEHKYISKEGIADPGQISISKDSDIEGLKRITDVIHKNGTKVIAQINHAGSFADLTVSGSEPISASAIEPHAANGKKGVVPKEMTQEDIDRMIQCFASAAKRAKEAGYDGVEIHSAHAYLLNQFYSPLTNKRTDGYGGSLEGRIRIHTEVIKAVREAVGEDYLIALRLGACDYTEGGSTLEDGVLASKAFEKAGVDLLDISGGFCRYMRPGHKEQGYFGELTEAIKREVTIPVILTGGIVDGESAESLLEQGTADFIGVGRAILKDSEWAKKVIEKNCK